MFAQSASAGRFAVKPCIWLSITCIVVLLSRSSSFSPMHPITVRPLDAAYCAFSPTSALVSPFSRRSECPTIANSRFKSKSISALISPVCAPDPAFQQSCEPTMTSSLSSFLTKSAYTEGGATPTCTPSLRVAVLNILINSEHFALEPFNFQLPTTIGMRLKRRLGDIVLGGKPLNSSASVFARLCKPTCAPFFFFQANKNKLPYMYKF
mmetsp:Transcript_9867/g.21504  ORF Transcript_9867/g.21504 Transcript_9867/m.21504 type:complete len:209 (-) Transcript_9867:6-632(-)